MNESYNATRIVCTRENIDEWYATERSRLEKMLLDLVSTMNSLIESRVGPGHFATGRVKSLESLREKANKKNEGGSYKYNNAIREIEDIVAVRIIVPFEDDVLDVKRLLSSHFTFKDPLRSREELQIGDLERPGYKSEHGILFFSGGPVDCVEVQLRTVLQHAWAQMSHDQLYKAAGKEMGTSLRRRLWALAGLLELADHEYADIMRTMDGFGGIEGQLNPQNLRDLGERVFGAELVYLDEAWVDELIVKLKGPGLDTMEQLIGSSARRRLVELKDNAGELRRRFPWANSMIFLEAFFREESDASSGDSESGPQPYSLKWYLSEIQSDHDGATL